MENKITYQFVPVPFKVIYACDALCTAVLITLLQKQKYWEEKKRLDDNGFFYLSNSEIENRIGYKRNVLNETIEALFRAQIIDVIPATSRKESNKYKINWETIMKYDKLSFDELNSPTVRISKVVRGEVLTYTRCNLHIDNSTNCTTTIELINNNKINNIHIKDNNSANCTITELPNCYLPEFLDNSNNEEKILDIFKCIIFGGCYEHKDFFTDKEHATLKDILTEFKKETPDVQKICFELQHLGNELSKKETKNAILAVTPKLEKAYKEATNQI